MRCGDILQYRHHREYGFSKYWVYADTITSSVKSIGIFSAPTDPEVCRGRDCNHLATCKALLEDLRSFLQETYPTSKVTVRNGLDEIYIDTYSRMVLADGFFCNPSTFCLYPAIASTGKGYLVDSYLYPFAKSIDKSKGRVETLETPFLNMQPIVDQRMNAQAIINWLRQPKP